MSFFSERNKNKKVVFFGDSITEMGTQPNGYILKINQILKHESIANYDLINEGVSGNKIYDLYLRMDEDVIQKTPNIVVIYEGVNDVWHKILTGTGTDIDKYEKFYRAVITKLKTNQIKIILVTPACIGEKNDGANPQDEDLNKYCDIIRKLGAEFKLPVCDLRTEFMNYEKEHNVNNVSSGILTVDGVHLTKEGNSLVAQQIWNILKEMK